MREKVIYLHGMLNKSIKTIQQENLKCDSK